MSHVPVEVKDFLRTLPDRWDDVKFIDGYPGKLMIVARRSGTAWYVAGLNGEPISKTVTLDLSFLKGKTGKKISSKTAESTEPSFQVDNVTVGSTGKVDVTFEKNDGFVMVFN